MSFKSILRKTSKIILLTFLSLILLVVILLASFKASENKITHLAMNRISEMIEAPVKMDTMSLIWLRKFPYATVKFTGFHMGVPYALQNDSSITNISDTLASLDYLFVSVKTKALLQNKIEIKKIQIEGINVHYDVDSTGATNFDFLMAMASTDTTQVEEPEADTTSSILDFLLQDLTLKDITLNYKDETMPAQARIYIPEIKLKGKVYDSYYAGKIKGSVLLTDAGFDNYKLNLMQKSELDFDLSYADDSVEVNKLRLRSDGVDFDIKGNAILGDSIYMDLGIDLSELNLAAIARYAPQELLDEFGVQQVEGKIAIHSNVKGYYWDSLLLPELSAQVDFEGGKVITRDYPAIQELALQGSFTNGSLQTNATTRADFPNILVKTDHSSIQMAASVENLDKPVYDLTTDMNIDLGEFESLIPKDVARYLNGKVKFNFATKGQLPDDLGMNSADYFMNRTKLALELQHINTAIDDTNIIEDLNLKFAYAPRRIDLSGLSLKAPGYSIALSNSNFNAKILGSVADMDNMGADIESFNLNIANSYLRGSAYLKGLSKPDFKINTDVLFNLADFKPFIHDTLAKSIGGTVAMKLNSYGTVDLDSVDTQAIPIAFEQTELQFKVDNFQIQEALQDPLYTVDDLDFDFAMADDTLLINRFFVSMLGTSFAMDSTSIWNLYKAYMLEQKDKEIIVQTNINMGHIDANALMALMPPDTTSTDSTTLLVEEADSSSQLQAMNAKAEEKAKELLAEETAAAADTLSSDSVKYLLDDLTALGLPHFLIRGKVAVKSVTYEKNYIDNISFMFRFADSLYVIDQFILNTCGGSMNTSMKFDARKWDKPVVDVKNIITHMDMKELLDKNDNFDQEDFTSDKISGILTSNLNFRAFFFDGSWDPPTDRMRVRGDMMLENGRIYDYEPLVELSNEMKTLGGLKGLDKLDFSTLKTSVFMLNDKIFFPKTDVVTSSMDLSATGMQQITVDQEDYEYLIEIHLGDVLTGKSNKLLEEQAKQDKKDGTTGERNGTKLIAKDREGETKYFFSNKEERDKMAKEVKRQESFQNLLFNPGLVNFSTALDRTEFKNQQQEKNKDKTE